MISINQYIEEAHTQQKNIRPGIKVEIVLKKDQGTDKRVSGQVGRILTSKGRHTRGIKVQLTDGQVGRVTRIL